MLATAAAALLLVLSTSPARARDAGVPIGAGTAPPVVQLTSPSGGWSVSRMLEVAGTVSDPTVSPVEVSINGDRYLMRAAGGRFARKFPAAAGRNVVTVRATNRGGSTTAQASAFARIPPVPLKAVLTSDTDGVYTDLHVYEPTSGSAEGGRLVAKKMAHVFWANTESPSGGTFYLNEQQGMFDQPGYGPYLYVHRAPPAGVYALTTNYWPSGDRSHTLATLNLALFEGTDHEIRRTVRVPLATQGTTRILAWIAILGEGRALVYVPGQDPEPPSPPWPTNLAETLRELGDRSSSEAGD